ncbi:hypothetical protein Z043_120153 [Scleropages formosus]|uniref:Uncharacterized protein n=1 Tax=Scleropages formosus TaxID=113540 RepID=A0A0P7TLD2_SCLFO|nr:hypothetical protein Z043_120153 [Scleropages formosus]
MTTPYGNYASGSFLPMKADGRKRLTDTIDDYKPRVAFPKACKKLRYSSSAETPVCLENVSYQSWSWTCLLVSTEKHETLSPLSLYIGYIVYTGPPVPWPLQQHRDGHSTHSVKIPPILYLPKVSALCVGNMGSNAGSLQPLEMLLALPKHNRPQFSL